MGNYGHRLGSDHNNENPNSAESLIVAWREQTRQDFKYWETDICETKDMQLVVNHDRTIKDGRKIVDLTLNEIKKAEPDRLELNELFDLFRAYDQQALDGVELIKPIYIEVKRLYTDEGRESLVKAIVHARATISSKVEIHCISFDNFRIKHFKKSFPKSGRDKWAFRFGTAKINMKKIGNHSKDLFGNPEFKRDLKGGMYEVEAPDNKKSIWRRVWNFLTRWF